MIQTRRTRYRGQDGWLVCGRPRSDSWASVSIFFEHESAARRTADRLRADPDYRTTLADYEP